MNYAQRYAVIVLTLVLGALPFVLGAPVGGGVSEGTSEEGTESSSQQVTITSGNVTLVNVSGNAITTRWAGFYGFISAGLRLTDASSNSFYEWTVTNVTDSVVYVANGTVSDFTTVGPGNESITPSYLHGTNPDSYNNTFTVSEVFTSASLSVASTPYTDTWQAGSQGSLRTYSLATQDNTVHIWAGKSIYNTTSFKGGTNATDYQILAPANSAGLTYNFYLELP